MVQLRVVPDDRRERSREKRRRQFLEAASRLIDRDGLTGVTIKALAEELDCAVGTVYLYFPSKAALVAELAGEAIGRLAGSYTSARASWEPVIADDHVDDGTTCLVELEAFAAFWSSAAVVYADEIELVRQLLGGRVELEASESVEASLVLLERLLAIPQGLLEGAEALRVLEGDDNRERALLWVVALSAVLQLDRLAAIDRHLFRAPHLARTLTMDLLVGWGADRADVEVAASTVERLAALGPMAPPPSGPGWD